MVRTRWMWLAVGVLMGLAVLASDACAAEGTCGGTEKAKQKVELPAAAAEAVKAAFPKAKIEKVKTEDEDGIMVYEVELEEGKTETEVTVSADGLLLEIETEVEMKDVPKAAADVIAKAADGATIKEIEKEEIRAEVKKENGTPRIVKLEKAKVVFSAELVKGDQKGEIEVAADGKVVEELKWKAKGADKPDDDEDDDDDDDNGGATK